MTPRRPCTPGNGPEGDGGAQEVRLRNERGASPHDRRWCGRGFGGVFGPGGCHVGGSCCEGDHNLRRAPVHQRGAACYHASICAVRCCCREAAMRAQGGGGRGAELGCATTAAGGLLDGMQTCTRAAAAAERPWTVNGPVGASLARVGCDPLEAMRSGEGSGRGTGPRSEITQ